MFFLWDPVTATAYSLFVVGTSALVGTLKNAHLGMIDYKTGIVFAIPAFTAIYLTRHFVMPAIPAELMQLGDFMLTKNIAIMVFFAVIMLLASYTMIKGRKDVKVEEHAKFNYPLILIQGFVVGLITGPVGAGGGFLIIQAWSYWQSCL